MERSIRYSYGRSNSQYQKTWREKIADWLRYLVAFMFTNVGIVGLVVVYTIGGAIMFLFIEGVPGDKSIASKMYETRTKTATELWNLTYHSNIFDEKLWRMEVSKILIKYQHIFVDRAREGYDPMSSLTWSFPGAFLYSLTVITTIGYGNLAPLTGWGKLATVVYAIVGMPLFLLYLSNIGDILAKSFKWTYFNLCLCRGWFSSKTFRRQRRDLDNENIRMEQIQIPYVQQEEFLTHQEWQMSHAEESKRARNSVDGDETENEDSDDEESAEGGPDEAEKSTTSSTIEYDPQSVSVPIPLCVAIMVGYVCGGALLFKEWEGWTLLDGSYFCFISLSTIGFGDIVPGDKIFSEDSRERYIATAVYLMLGMALIAMCFNLMQEEVVHKTRTCIRVCKNIFACQRDASYE